VPAQIRNPLEAVVSDSSYFSASVVVSAPAANDKESGKL
jgi:hypothetical protein